MKTKKEMLFPLPFTGEIQDIEYILYSEYSWLRGLTNSNTFVMLHNNIGHNLILPNSYDYYILTHHLEPPDIDWLTKQSKSVDGTIFILYEGNSYNFNLPNVIFLPYFYQHHAYNKMIEWFGLSINKTIKYKTSMFCNRITESKLITFTAIAEYMGLDNLLVLHDWLEEKNIDPVEHIHHSELLKLHDTFFKRYYGTEITIDDFINSENNFQSYTANPWQPSYQECAIHFTGESLSLSDISTNIGDYQYPGPHLSEKTLKCLLGQTAFVPTGQFNTYNSLQQLGFKFDYNFDTSFDSIIGDHDRLLGIVNIIKQFANMSKEELFEGTRESSIYNYNHIVNGDFYDICEEINKKSITKVLNIIE